MGVEGDVIGVLDVASLARVAAVEVSTKTRGKLVTSQCMFSVAELHHEGDGIAVSGSANLDRSVQSAHGNGVSAVFREKIGAGEVNHYRPRLTSIHDNPHVRGGWGTTGLLASVSHLIASFVFNNENVFPDSVQRGFPRKEGDRFLSNVGYFVTNQERVLLKVNMI